jgi:hypothetical protein
MRRDPVPILFAVALLLLLLACLTGAVALLITGGKT